MRAIITAVSDKVLSMLGSCADSGVDKENCQLAQEIRTQYNFLQVVGGAMGTARRRVGLSVRV